MRIAPVVFAVSLAMAASAQAQFAITWWTVDGGGGTSSGGLFTLSGTIGQPDAGVLAGGSFAIHGGFWVGGSGTACPADLDDGSGTGASDGAVTIDDLLYLLGKYEAGDVAADLDDGSGTGTLDGAVTIDDLLYFLEHYEGGC